MAHEYGRKIHNSIETDSLSVMEWKITTASVYDKKYSICNDILETYKLFPKIMKRGYRRQ